MPRKKAPSTKSQAPKKSPEQRAKDAQRKRDRRAAVKAAKPAAAVPEVGAPSHEPPTTADVKAAAKDRDQAKKAHQKKLQDRQNALDKAAGKTRSSQSKA